MRTNAKRIKVAALLLLVSFPVVVSFRGIQADALVPVEIGSLEELRKIGADGGYPLDGHYVLTCDIDAGETVEWNGGKGWRSIGINPQEPFCGVFDGRGHTIKNLHINNLEESSGGLFGSLTGTMKNLALSNLQIVSDGPVGGLARGVTGTVINCHTSGTVRGFTNVGGLAGMSPDSFRSPVITCCSSSCTVVLLYNGVTDSNYGGGLIGSSVAAIDNCYATGCVVNESGHAVHCVGGLVGQLGPKGSITNSYATGNVCRSEALTHGGLAGVSTGTIISSYYDAVTTGMSDTGKGEPRDTGAMKYPHAEDTYAGWDFNNVWSADIDGTVNGGYPYLKAFVPVMGDKPAVKGEDEERGY